MIRRGGMESFYSEPDLSRQAIERQTRTAELINGCCVLCKHVVKLYDFHFFLHLLGKVRLDLSIGGQTLPWCWDTQTSFAFFPLKQKVENESHPRLWTPGSWWLHPNLIAGYRNSFPLRVRAIPSLRNTGDWLIVNVLTYLVLIFPRSISSPGKRRVDFWSMRSKTVIMTSKKWQVI